MIPKLIHQIWIQGKDHLEENYPKKYNLTKSIENIFSKEWKHKIWSEKEILNLIYTYYPLLLKIYKNAPNFSAKADIGRYVIMSIYGGLYLDIDFEVIKDFSWMLEDKKIELVVVRSDTFLDIETAISKFRYNCACFASSVNHRLILDMIKYIISMGIFGTKFKSSILYCLNTGPSYYSQLLESYYYKLSSTRVISNTMLEFLTFNNVGTNKNITREEIINKYPAVYGIHHMDGSWIAGSNFIKNGPLVIYSKCREHWIIIFITFIFIIIILSLIIKLLLIKKNENYNLYLFYKNKLKEMY